MKKPIATMRRGEDPEAKRIMGEHTSMKAERRPNERYYRKAARLFTPQSVTEWCTTQQHRKELERNSNLYTSVGVNSVRRNTNFFMSNATPETGIWWRTRPVDPDLMDNDAVAEWAKKVDRKVRREQAKSLYIALRKAFKAMFVSYGMIYQGIRRDRGQSQREVFYEHVPSHSIWYRKNLYGEIFEAIWERSIGVNAFYEQYGSWPDGYETEDARKRSGKTAKIRVLVYVYRNYDFKENPRSPSEHEFIEKHVECKGKDIVAEYGHMFMPFHEIKMDDGDDNDYPVGIAYDALPDSLSADRARKAQQQSLAFAGRPVMLTSIMDAVSSYGKNLVPGGMIEQGLNSDGKPNMAPLDGMFRPEVFNYAVMEDEARVRDTLGQNELIQNHSDNMTATAARIVAAERAAMVAPFVNSIMPVLRRMCENHIQVLAEFDQLPEMPEALADADQEIEIVSPMAMQARAHEGAALQEALSYIQVLAALDPAAIQALQIPDALRIIAEATGLEHVINASDYEAARDAARQQASAMAELEAAQANAQTADTEAAALSKVAQIGG